MDEIIKKIVDSENYAKGIVKKAEHERNNIDREIEKSASEIIKRCADRAKREIEKVSGWENDAAKAQISKLSRDYSDQMANMRAADKKYRDKWIQTFFASVVGEEYAGMFKNINSTPLKDPDISDGAGTP